MMASMFKKRNEDPHAGVRSDLLDEVKAFLHEYRTSHKPGAIRFDHYKAINHQPLPISHTWPFADSTYKGWGYSVENHLWTYHPCEKSEVVVQPAMLIKEQAETNLHYCSRAAQYLIGVNELECAQQVLRIAYMEIPAEPTCEECMLHAISMLWLGILLSAGGYSLNEHEAVTLFDECAHVYKFPGACYYYGLALRNGWGGLHKDVDKAVGYLQHAGARGINEAYFALGSMYEADDTGLSITEGIIKASHFYKAVTKKAYEYDVAADGGWYTNLFGLSSVKLIADRWHLQDNAAVEMTGTRYNWSLVGQTFLFTAVASFDVEEKSTEDVRTIMIPVLGLLIACFSWFHMVDAIFRHWWRNETLVREMNDDKIAAFFYLIGKASTNCHVGYKKTLETEQAKLEKVQQKVRVVRILMTLSLWSYCLVETGFMIVWILLLARIS